MKIKFFFIVSYILIESCTTTTKIIKYPEIKNEVYVDSKLRNFFNGNKSPRIVLRITQPAAKTLVESTAYNYLYNAMENEIIKQGFRVKDRKIFNEIISKTYSSESFKQELTDVDFVLEVINIDDKIVYSTNTITEIRSKKIREKKRSMTFKNIGGSVEYRIIDVRNNEIGGTFKFHYQPCAHGCPLSDFKFEGRGRNREVQLPKTLPSQTLKQFIISSIQELVHSLKQTPK